MSSKQAPDWMATACSNSDRDPRGIARSRELPARRRFLAATGSIRRIAPSGVLTGIRALSSKAARRLAAPLLRSLARSRAPATLERERRLPGITAALLATLLTSTIALTMDRSAEDLVTLALHYPLFFVIAVSTLACVPPGWRTVLCLAALPLLGIEAAAMR